jgi:hypothetical protein
MNIQRMRFVADIKKVCNFFLIMLLLVFGEGKSKRFNFSLVQLNFITILRLSHLLRVGFMCPTLPNLTL